MSVSQFIAPSAKQLLYQSPWAWGCSVLHPQDVLETPHRRPVPRRPHTQSRGCAPGPRGPAASGPTAGGLSRGEASWSWSYHAGLPEAHAGPEGGERVTIPLGLA